ncbi:MAG: amino acid ABC transporter permease [Gammaproteobacteria bacterium]|nr:amino acid ABC transporter permease [Gammaproteobacteria bacterium]
MKTFVNKRPPIPGIATGSTTDLPVLLPTAGRLAQRARRDRLEGTWRLELKLWHGVLLVILFLLFAGIAEAQSQAEPDKGPLATLFRWIPVLLWKNGNGFVLNLTISFFAMAIGTVAGMALGLAQVSLLAPVRTGSWFTTQFFRNSPWLVLLFCIMLLFPFEIELGSTVFKIPDWTKATIGFSLPVMANLSEIVRGAVQSIPTGQWESAESLAFTRRQTMWMIILPQCFKRMIPPWMNWYAILTMATPLCSIMGVEESVRLAQDAMAAEDSRTELLGPFYVFLLIVFFIYCYPIARLTIALEKKYTVNI